MAAQRNTSTVEAPEAEAPEVAPAEVVELSDDAIDKLADAIAARLRQATVAPVRGAMASTFAERRAAREGRKPQRGESK